MRPAGDHVDSFDPVSAHFEGNFLSGVDVSLFDQAMSMNNNELLPLAVMPVLTFRNAGLADVNGYLSTVNGVQSFQMLWLTRRTCLTPRIFHNTSLAVFVLTFVKV